MLKELDKFVGNSSAVNHVRAIIESRNLPNAVLLYGHYGAGKTTLARVLAKSFTSDINIFEYNSAFLSSVDNARQIVSIIKDPPLVDNFRVFILDECHRASPQFFDVLLKPLEEAEYGKFILCTTETSFINKYQTVASRCVKIKVSPLNKKETQQLIAKKLGKKIASNTRLVELVYSLTGGVPRDILICCAEISRIGDVEAGMVYLQEHFLVKKGGNLSKFAHALLSPRVSDSEFEELFYSVVDTISTKPEELRIFIASKLEEAIRSRALPISLIVKDSAASELFEIISKPWYSFLDAVGGLAKIRTLLKGV